MYEKFAGNRVKVISKTGFLPVKVVNRVKYPPAAGIQRPFICIENLKFSYYKILETVPIVQEIAEDYFHNVPQHYSDFSFQIVLEK